MDGKRYDGLADEYDAFIEAMSSYYVPAHKALTRLLEPGRGRCLDIACGGGHFLSSAAERGWRVVGIDASVDQLGIARGRQPAARFVVADAARLPFADESFDAAFSTFTHTDLDDFAAAMREARRILRPGGRLVYVGNHPCFVGPTQEHQESGVPRLHPGYRRAGWWQASEAPGTRRGGWRERLGSFVHLPLGEFLASFAGLTLIAVEELADGFEYPKTIALAFSKP